MHLQVQYPPTRSPDDPRGESLLFTGTVTVVRPVLSFTNSTGLVCVGAMTISAGRHKGKRPHPKSESYGFRKNTGGLSF